MCTGLDPAWNNIRTETTFPVDTGTELTVTCEDEFLQRGSDTVTCTDDTTFNSDTTPACVGLGEYYVAISKHHIPGELFVSRDKACNFDIYLYIRSCSLVTKN